MDPQQRPQTPPQHRSNPWADNPPEPNPPTSDPNNFEPIGDEDIPDEQLEEPTQGDPSSYVDDQVGEDGTRFEPIGAIDATPKEPFTDEEILDGTAIVAMIAGARAARVPIQNEADVETFQKAYKNILAPYISTAAVIKPLKLGPALARYGIHKNMGPGFDLERVPALARLGIGAVILSVSGFLGLTAVARSHTGQRAAPEPQRRDPLNTDPPDRPPEPEPEPPRAEHTDAPAPDQAASPPAPGAQPGQPWM